MGDIVTSEIISQSAVPSAGSSADELVLLSDVGHNLVYRLTSGGRRLVLKTVRPDDADAAQQRQFLQREYQLLLSLQHPFIVSVWQMADYPALGECLWMEYIDGRTVDVFLSENPDGSLRRQVLDELLQAVAYIHGKQIVHADIKPQNILITHNGNHVKLIDLGLADNASWRESNLGNTRLYAAPEQRTRGGKLDQRTDIYALGHILRLLFPHRYRLIARRCLQSSPQRRFRSVEQLRTAIRRQKYWSVAIPLCLIAAVVLPLYILFPHSPAPTPEQPLPLPDTVVIVSSDTVFVTPATPPTPVFDPDSLKKAVTAAIYNRCLDSISNLTYRYYDFALCYIDYFRRLCQKEYYRQLDKFPSEYTPEISIIYYNCDFALSQYDYNVSHDMMSVSEAQSQGLITPAEGDSLSSALHRLQSRLSSVN